MQPRAGLDMLDASIAADGSSFLSSTALHFDAVTNALRLRDELPPSRILETTLEVRRIRTFNTSCVNNQPPSP